MKPSPPLASFDESAYVTRVQVCDQFAYTAGLSVTVGAELRMVGHQSVCVPAVTDEPLLDRQALVDWADETLRQRDPRAAEQLALTRRRHAALRSAA